MTTEIALGGFDMNVQRYARIAGVLFLLSLVAGGFGEAYIPSKLIVSGDAAATAANIRNFDFLYRLGFATFLIESFCDVTLALILTVWLLVKGVDVSKWKAKVSAASIGGA